MYLNLSASCLPNRGKYLNLWASCPPRHESPPGQVSRPVLPIFNGRRQNANPVLAKYPGRGRQTRLPLLLFRPLVHPRRSASANEHPSTANTLIVNKKINPRCKVEKIFLPKKDWLSMCCEIFLEIFPKLLGCTGKVVLPLRPLWKKSLKNIQLYNEHIKL